MARKNAAAVALGKLGGKTGTEAQRLARRQNIKKARETRWKKKRLTSVSGHSNLSKS